MRTAGSNHKDFDSKKEALAFLKKNALMSVGWKEGNKDKVAIYWNGRLHTEDAKTKKIWGSERVARELLKMARALVAVREGETDESDAIRVSRSRSAIRVWDMENAGKRGKKVDVIALYDLDYASHNSTAEANVGGKVEDLAQKIMSANSFSKAAKMLKDAEKAINEVSQFKVAIYESQERGVDVPPAGFQPIKVNGKYVYIQSGYKDFVVRDKEDQYNEPTCIPAIKGGKRDVQVFYRWVKDNESKIKNMHFSDVTKAMGKNGIKYHYYCAVD